MSRYILSRFVAMGLNLFLVTIFVFLLLRSIPGDVSVAVLGINATPDQYATFREEHGLDDSLFKQYRVWVGNTLQGDFGRSLYSNAHVANEFRRHFSVSFEVILLSFAFTTFIGITFGIVSAVSQNGVLDYSVRLLSVFFLSIPSFLLLTLLLIVPVKQWGYAPPFGAINFIETPWDNLRLFVPPTLLLSLGSAAGLMRLTRTAFLDVMRQDYMRTARAKGLSDNTVVLRHGMRNAFAPILAVIGVQLGNLFGGSVIVESVMGLPGVGTWALQAIQTSDYPIVMMFSLYVAFVIMTLNLCIDLLYGVFDPRIRHRQFRGAR